MDTNNLRKFRLRRLDFKQDRYDPFSLSYELASWMLFTIIALLLFTKLEVHSRKVEFSIPMKFDVDKFNEGINFDLRQV